MEGRSPLEAAFIRKNIDLFGENTELPPFRKINHRIELEPGHKPPCLPIYRMSPDELEQLRVQLAKLLEKGHIRPSTSAFGAPVLFVRKSDGSLRLCVDHRALNKITVKNAYPLPRIDDLLDRLQGATHVSSCDLTDAFHQMRIEPEDVHKSAFRTRYGHYEFLVMPFGMSSCPGHMQSLLQDIFGDMVDVCVLIYLDDLCVFSKSAEEHERHLQEVANRLRQHKIKLKLKSAVSSGPQSSTWAMSLARMGSAWTRARSRP